LSRELCGGTHLHSTGQIGFFHILSESSVGAGLRRIEAVTGRGAELFFEEQLALLYGVSAALETRPAELLRKVSDLTEQLKAQQREISSLRSQALRDRTKELVQSSVVVGGARVLSKSVQADSSEQLRELIDLIREGLAQQTHDTAQAESLVVLGSVIGGRVALIATASGGLVKRGLHAGKLVGEIARSIGGSGGGRPELGQAGGGNADRLQSALSLAQQRAHELLSGEQAARQG